VRPDLTGDPMAHGSPPKPSSSGRVARTLVALSAVCSFLVAAGAAAGIAFYLKTDNEIPHPHHTLGASGTEATNEVKNSKIADQCDHRGCNFLPLGSDSRAGLSTSQQQEFGTNGDIGGSQRSDTIMVVHIPPGNQKAVILSFPRDLWVNIPGHGRDKINAAFEGGVNGDGPQVVASTITRLSGLRINHWMYVDLAGFEGVVNALGGVRMCVPTPMYDPLTALRITQPGCRDFDGQEALAYVRTRHWKAIPDGPECDTIGDFARIGRQQQFLRAVFAKVLSPSEFPRVASNVKELLQNFVVDPSLDFADMAYYVGQLRGITTGAADFRVVPTTTDVVKVNSWPYHTDIVRAVEPQARDLFSRILNNQPLGDLGKQQQQTPPSPATISVDVYDQGSNALAQSALRTLQESGFVTPTTVSASTELKKPVNGSVLLYRKSQLRLAQVVQSYLPSLKLEPVADSALPSSPVAAVISSRYDPSAPSGSTGGGGEGGGGRPSNGGCPT
jgi:LCP family protein required for cell wall assembly